MLDSTDRKILSFLQNNGRLPFSSIAKKMNMATSTVHERVRKMEARGDIIEFNTWVNPSAAGLNILAFIHVLVVGVEYEIPFLEHMTSLPEVEECFDLTGEWSYILKIRARNIEELSQFRRKHINPAQGVARTNTSIAMTTFKETRAIRLSEPLSH